MKLNLDAITETVSSGEVLEKQIVVENTGNEVLNLAITPSSYFTVSDQIVDETSSISYVFKKSLDNS